MIVFTDPHNNESYEVILGADRRVPDPNEVDKFIASQISEKNRELVLKQFK